MSIFIPSHAKKMADRRFNRWLFFIVPIYADNGETPVSSRCHPDVLNGSGSFNFSQGKSLSGIDADIGVYFPSLTQITGSMSSIGRIEDRKSTRLNSSHVR